ncbi:MAG: hypothetical protein WD081_08505 [Gammaproteobacteria bacterium]
MGKSIRRFLAAALVLAPTVVPADDWLFDGTVGLIGYDNVGRSRYPADHRSETALELDAAARRQPGWQTPGVFEFEIWAGLDRYDRFPDLNQVRAGVGASYYDRVGLGPTSPWWSLFARLGYHDYGSQLRDGPVWQWGVAGGRRWAEKVDLTGRIAFRRQRAASNVFSTSTVRVSADLDYRITPRWGTFGGLAWQRGDLSSALLSPGNAGPVWVDDPAFGAGWRSYRVDADVVALGVGVTANIGQTTQLLLAWERLDGRARDFSADYDGSIYKVQLTHEF